MVRNRDEQRLALNFADSLKRIGVEAQVRSYDEVQYQQRRQKFAYDMIIGQWLNPASPGLEQRSRWGSGAIDQPASVNLSGASSAAIDAMIDALLAARNNDDLVTAAHALERVLPSGFYVVPLFHINELWEAHSAKLARPERLPQYPMLPFGMILESWWIR